MNLPIVNNPPCQHCNAACCKQYGDHTYSVALFADEFYPDEIIIAENGMLEKALPFLNGSCVYLGEDNRCKIYDQRPRLCRNFNCCNSYLAKGRYHSFFLEDNPEVATLIETHCPEFVAEVLYNQK